MKLNNKQKNILLSLAALAVMVIAGCSKDSGTNVVVTPDPTKSADIAASAFATSATGGDPRGLYAPNTPLSALSAAGLSATFGTNTGTGTIKLEGSSASAGTYTTNNFSLSIKGVSINAGALGSFSLPDTTVARLISIPSTGTWEYSSGKLLFNKQDFGGIAVTDKALFLIRSLTAADLGFTGLPLSGTIILAFKK